METVLDEVCASCGNSRMPDGKFCLFCGDVLTEPRRRRVRLRNRPGVICILNDPTDEPFEYAGFWLRVWAGAIDIGIECLGAFVLTFSLDFALSRFGRFLGLSPFDSKVAVGMAFIMILAVGSWLYCAFMESSSWGATIGKRLLGLKVICADGSRTSFGVATVRHLMKFLSLFILMIGFLMSGWTKRRQALHDMPCDCLVIRVPVRPFSLLGHSPLPARWAAPVLGVISKQMFQSLAQVRKWLVVGVCVLVAAVTISYWIARSRVAPVLHNVPQQLGIDIQQTSDGFSLSKSEGGRTIYTIKASKAVQFKQGGHAELKNVDIVVYGKNHDRYDQIYGDHFTYDQSTGDIQAVGEVHIDLQGNAEGPAKPDQATPAELKNPLHLVTNSLTFNQKTGIAQTDAVVNFQTEQAGVRRRAPTTTPSKMSCS